MNAPFKPRGEQSIRDLCIEAVRALEPGERILYAEIMDRGECDLQVAQGSMNAARAVLEANSENTVKTVTNIGWQVISFQENLRVIDHRQRKAGRASGRAGRILAATQDHREELDHNERHDLDEKARKQRVMDLAFSRRRLTAEEITKAATAPERTEPTALEQKMPRKLRG
jgi:hypothetical protein